MTPSKEVLTAEPKALASIDPDQTLKASKALLAHIKRASKQKAEESSKRNLLEESDGDTETTIWLTLTTKRHIADKARLQPGKISLPHSLNTSGETTICLITANPQRAYKSIVASDEFPAELRKKVTRVIDFTKLKAKYNQYEAQRKLFSEHDVFLGDDRIINRLPKVLGKTFYKTTLKRPIPVVLSPKAHKVDGKRTKKLKEGEVNAGSPADIAKEITKALSSALVSLTPTTSTAVRIGFSNWTAEQLAANAEAVAAGMIEKWVPQKWRNVKSIYIKGQETAALPIWLTDELWLNETDIIADKMEEEEEEEETKAIKAAEKANIGKKRKSHDGAEQAETPASKKKAKKQRDQSRAEGDDGKLDKQISDLKARLRKQKAGAKKAMEE